MYPKAEKETKDKNIFQQQLQALGHLLFFIVIYIRSVLLQFISKVMIPIKTMLTILHIFISISKCSQHSLPWPVQYTHAHTQRISIFKLKILFTFISYLDSTKHCYSLPCEFCSRLIYCYLSQGVPHILFQAVLLRCEHLPVKEVTVRLNEPVFLTVLCLAYEKLASKIYNLFLKISYKQSCYFLRPEESASASTAGQVMSTVLADTNQTGL